MQLARIDMAFHADCWTTMHDEVQTGYRDRARDEGVAALVGPYRRTGAASWLPEAAIDDVVEDLQARVEQHLSTEADSASPGPAAMPEPEAHDGQTDSEGADLPEAEVVEEVAEDVAEDAVEDAVEEAPENLGEVHTLPEPLRQDRERDQASATG